MNLPDLLEKTSQHTEIAFTEAEIQEALAVINGWLYLTNPRTCIRKIYHFKNYDDTLAYVNAIAAMIHKEDHHPQLTITYNQCIVDFDTHSVNGGKGGISLNDFICAAKCDAIFAQQFS